MRFFLKIIIFSTYLIGFSQKDTLSLVAVGDIMMGTTFPNHSYLPPKGVDPFKEASVFFKNRDLVFGNLEGVLSDTGKNAKFCKDITKCYSFKSPEYFSTYLKNSGFNIMSIANNHIGDFGKTGINNTVRNLEENQINYAGIFKKPFTIFTIDNITYGFCAFAPNKDCIKLTDIENAKKIVTELEKQCDIVIVSFHGGAEGKNATRLTKKTEYFYGENRGDLFKFTHAMIDCGADIVIGHGPHVVRAIEVYKNKLIAYSLGNFCTYKRFNLSGISGYSPILDISFDRKGNFLSGKIISLKQRDAVYPYLDNNQLAFHEIKRLTDLDFPEHNFKFNDDGSFSLFNH